MFNPTQGSARQPINSDELEPLLRSGSVIVDDRRTRPYYFDGRFLTAKDLTRDQNYFLTRQADLGRAGGFGVVQGLMVSRGATAASIQIAAGHGVTIAGELVLLPEIRQINLADLAEVQRLDATFGLSAIPAEPLRNASGLFVVALRPVEYTANPIASYPTSVSGSRSVNDGDIVEAVAVTLIPYAEAGSVGADLARSRVAYEIFVAGAPKGIPADVLPLAMVALDRGVVQWVDSFLVRREVGAEQGNILSLGFAPRALKEAYLLQYQQQFQEVLQLRQSSNRGSRFSASEHFQALPPAGQLPAGAIDPSNFTQLYFPSTVDVSLAFIPSDEVTALVEESLLLPPIDLTLGADALDSIGVLVLIPVNRQEFQRLQRSLQPTFPALTRAVLPAAPGLVAKRSPLEALQTLRLPRFPIPIPPLPDSADTEWSKALTTADLLWYVRRRNLPYRSDPTGYIVPVFGNDVVNEQNLVASLGRAGLLDRVNQVRRGATAIANADVVSILSSPRLEKSKILLSSVVSELESAKSPPATDPADAPPVSERLDQATVQKVASRFGDPRLGEGVLRLEETNAGLKEDAIAAAVAQSGAVPELDQLARTLPDADLQAFSSQLADTARSGGAADVSTLIRNTLTQRAITPLTLKPVTRLGGMQP